MADDVAITAGSGTNIATDDCTSGHVQLTKLAYSADGDRTHVPADANGLLVNLGANNTVFVDDAAFTLATSKLNAIGGYAVAHGSAPDAADAGDAGVVLMNRHRIPFVVGGHPNLVTASVRIAAATGAQTDAAISPGAISAGTKIVVTRLTVTCSNANSVNVAVKLGFGASTIPADSTTGAAGVLADHEGVPPGGGFTIGDGSGMLGVGGDGEELRLTCDAPTGGFVIVSYSYYTIES